MTRVAIARGSAIVGWDGQADAAVWQIEIFSDARNCRMQKQSSGT